MLTLVVLNQLAGYERDPRSCAAPNEAKSTEVHNWTRSGYQSHFIGVLMRARHVPLSSGIPDLSDRENGRTGTTCEN